MDKKHDAHICCLQKTHLRTKDLPRLRVKCWKKILQVNRQEKTQGSNTYIRQKDFETKYMKRDTEEHFIILREGSTKKT